MIDLWILQASGVFGTRYSEREALVLVTLRFAGFRPRPWVNRTPAVHPEGSGGSARRQASPPRPRTGHQRALCPRCHCSFAAGPSEGVHPRLDYQATGPGPETSVGAPSLRCAEGWGRPTRQGRRACWEQCSCLTRSLSPSSLLPAFALPSGGSESGRSTPSLSVLSDSKPPPCTYQQAPRHFHVPGRHPGRPDLRASPSQPPNSAGWHIPPPARV